MLLFYLCPFLAGAEYQLFGTRSHDGTRHRPRVLLPRHLNEITGKRDSIESVSKRSVTNADSGGHEQNRTKSPLQIKPSAPFSFCFALHVYSEAGDEENCLLIEDLSVQVILTSLKLFSMQTEASPDQKHVMVRILHCGTLYQGNIPKMIKIQDGIPSGVPG